MVLICNFYFVGLNNMYEILMYICNRYRLDQLNINYTYSFLFDDCNCSEEHEIFTIKCEVYLSDLTAFGRDYFSFIYCNCVHLNKNLVLCHCKRLRYALNTDTIKTC